jgi:hypothetical protein
MKWFVKVKKWLAAAGIVLLKKLEKYSAELRVVEKFNGARHALNPSNVLVQFTKKRADTFDNCSCMTGSKGCFADTLRPMRIYIVIGGGNFFKGDALGIYDILQVQRAAWRCHFLPPDV